MTQIRFVHSDSILYEKTWSYALPMVLTLGLFQFFYAFLYPIDSNFILELSKGFYFIFTIIFIWLLFVRRIYGIGIFVLSLIVIPSGGGIQPLTYLSDKVSIPYYELWLFILGSVWLFDRLAKGDLSIPPILKSYWMFILGLLWMVGVGLIQGNPFVDIILDLREISYFLILATIIPDYIKSKNDVYWLLTIFAIGVVIGIILYYIWYLVMVADTSSILNKIMEKYETAGFRVEYRLIYSIITPATIAVLILSSLVLLGVRLNVYMVVLFFLLIGLIVLNQLRATYVMTVFGIFLLLVRYKSLGILSFGKITKFVSLVIGLVFLGALLSIILSQDFLNALRSRASTLLSLEYLVSNITSRMVPFIIAMEQATCKEWLFGQGMGTLIYIPWFEGTDFRPMNRYLDNLWATVIIKGGLLGIVSSLSFFIVFIQRIKKIIQIRDDLFPIWIALWCFGIINIIGTKAIFYDTVHMALFGFFSGIILGRIEIIKVEKSK